MRIALYLATAILLSATSIGQSSSPPQGTCASADSSCKPASNSDLKKAHKLYDRAQKLQHEGKFQEATEHLDRATELAPHVPEYVSLREMIRQQQVAMHLERGNKLLNAGKNVEAMAEFRQAIEIDPKNEFALQRLQDTLPAYVRPQSSSVPLSHALTVVAESRPPVLQPNNARREFHFKGMTRNLLEQVSTVYGIKPIFDESVQSKLVKMDLDEVDFFTAVREAAKLAHVFWVPVSSNQVLFVNDTQALRREYERMVARTFYINEATAPQDVNDVVNLLRTIFDIRFVVAQPSNNSVAVRAPEATLDAAAKVLESFLSRKPQVNLQIQVFAVSHQLTRQLGISLPLSFQAINVGAAALLALGQGSGNIQDAINQLIASGGINNVDPAGLQALIAQLQNQQQNSAISSLLKTPFATFGGGKTLTAVPIPPLSANFSLNESNFSSLSDLTLRTAQNNAATMRIGSRYPILNASFAPVFNTAAISQVLQNGSFAAPFPSFTYEDIGISVKATPQVLGDNSVNLKLEMSIRALTGQSFNNIPVISNREYNATTSVLDGQPAVVAGMITQSEQKSLSGIPGIGRIPGLRDATSNRTANVSSDELLIVITPHIVSPTRKSSSADEVWVPAT
jgi:type II secretory pathway component GspD/PulD (secretin)